MAAGLMLKGTDRQKRALVKQEYITNMLYRINATDPWNKKAKTRRRINRWGRQRVKWANIFNRDCIKNEKIAKSSRDVSKESI
jgi:hypothetical protein